MDASPQKSPLDWEVAAVGRIAAVPSILDVICQVTGMGFAVVARVTDGSWTVCAVQDHIQFGLLPGGQLDVHTTLCKEVRESREPIAINHASQHPVYCQHHTPRMYAIESYISVPIVLSNGDYFGNLCAIDPRPAEVANAKILTLFKHLAHLIALELDSQMRTEAVVRELLDERADGVLREQFIAVVGHDLRNPLSAISACTHLLERQLSNPQAVADLSKRIGTNVKRMTRLIDDLLDLARSRLGGGLQVGMAPINDLPRAITDVLDELSLVHPDREIISTIKIDHAVLGDRGRLQQLVSNLVSNALTHGAADTPVEVTATTQAGHLQIVVRNDGEPIPPDTMAGIFDAFSRPDAPTGRSDGLGLGLYICQQIVAAHGGELSVTSTEDGTVFTAKLPERA